MEVRSQAKEQNEARNRTLIDQSSDLVLVVDRAGRADFLSPSVERLLALHDQDHLTTANTVATTVPVDFIAAVDLRDRARLAEVLQAAAPGHMSAGEFRITGWHGTSTFEFFVQDLCADRSVGGLVLTGHDVTDRLALLDALAIPFLVEGVDLYVEASIGVVISGEHGQDSITLMQHADIAMYIAKSQYLGVSVYDPAVDGHSATQLALVGDVRPAVPAGESSSGHPGQLTACAASPRRIASMREALIPSRFSNSVTM